MRFLDLFSGIGGFRLGMEKAGHVCVGHCEIDSYANKSYQAIHEPKEGEWSATDITKVSNEEWQKFRGTVDVICGGFPCQAFSVAGKRQGFSDTRGTLFFEIARAAEQIQPRFLFLENVRGLLSHNKGQTFATILATLDELGYDVEWQVLNSKNFGVPQNRERVFIIGHLRGQSRQEIFPLGNSNTKADELQTQTTNTVTARYGGATTVGTYVIENQQNGIIQRSRGKNKGGVHDISPTLTINSFQDNNFLLDGDQVRKLTPKECWRLQGFPDWAFDRAKNVGISDTQLYKQAGNSVTVNVIQAIAEKLKEVEVCKS